MANHFNWNFPQRSETMFMATIQSSMPNHSSYRQSSFLKNDIPGAQNKLQIPTTVSRQNYVNSAYIEPKPQSHIIKNKFVETNNLRTRDIQYAYPRCTEFKTNRTTNPLLPKYSLPSVSPLLPQPPTKFLRNTLDTSDISAKREPKIVVRDQRYQQSIEGSSPNKLFRSVDAKSRLQVKDINQDGVFLSSRMKHPTNPLEPTYTWRETPAHVNNEYGDIGNRCKEIIPVKVNNKNDLSLSTNDIEGAKANSSNEKKYFFNMRRQYRDILNTEDIGKTHASSLKKGITTKRIVNPLMPQYTYIDH